VEDTHSGDRQPRYLLCTSALPRGERVDRGPDAFHRDAGRVRGQFAASRLTVTRESLREFADLTPRGLRQPASFRKKKVFKFKRESTLLKLQNLRQPAQPAPPSHGGRTPDCHLLGAAPGAVQAL
jgi:hypothetical protein